MLEIVSYSLVSQVLVEYLFFFRDVLENKASCLPMYPSLHSMELTFYNWVPGLLNLSLRRGVVVNYRGLLEAFAW